jgi:hypothetical protein
MRERRGLRSSRRARSEKFLNIRTVNFAAQVAQSDSNHFSISVRISRSRSAHSRRSCSLRNARAKGKRLGRPPKDLDARRIATLCAQGTRLEGHRQAAGSWGRNSISLCPRAFQNSGKGFWNAAQPSGGLNSSRVHNGLTTMGAEAGVLWDRVPV